MASDVQISDKLAVTSTEAVVFRYAPKKAVNLRHLAVAYNAEFGTYGKLRISVKGRLITNPDAGGWVTMLSSVSALELPANAFFEGMTKADEVLVEAAVTGGSGTPEIQVMIIAEML